MKNPIIVVKVTFAFFFSALLITPAFSQKFDKFVDKVNVANESGDYIRARKNNIKFRKKVNKKLGSQNNYVVEYYLIDRKSVV